MKKPLKSAPNLEAPVGNESLSGNGFGGFVTSEDVEVTWILESNVFAEVCFDEMVNHFKVRGIPYHVVRIIPFLHEIDGPTPYVTGPVVVYGSIGTQKLAEANGWRPGVFAIPTEAETQAALGDLYLNADLVRMNISQVSEYLRTSQDNTVFIKPDTDTKEFAGQVIDRETFDEWYDGMVDSGYLTGNDFPVVLSTPKKLGCEWRVVVVNGEISSSSLYRQYGIVKPERHIIPEVEAIVMAAHERFQPADVYVIDIAQLGDEFKVIEYNTFNSAGLYACSVIDIIDDINDFIRDQK
jgi:hypothetical protein